MEATPTVPLRHLGALPVAEFMRTTWQRRPRLIRDALDAGALPIDASTLFALAQRADVESRLVSAFDGRWSLRHGPLSPRQLPPCARPGWTVLVQGVDLVLPAAAALRDRFRFICDARLDDVMVSYASDGGGVGPHVDSYDVFLLQLRGRRRWRISRQRDLALRPGLPLKILARFQPTQEWVLEPGDMLYLPPGVAHDGSADGADCITASIGFRAPRHRELLDPWLDAQAESAQRLKALDALLIESARRPATRPAQLPADLIDRAYAQLSALPPRRDHAAQALLAVLSEPKPAVTFTPRSRPLTPARFAQRVARHGLHLDPRTRLLYSERRIGINGDVISCNAADMNLLKQLANARLLKAHECGTPSEAALSLLHEWYVDGWLHSD
jgi:50S ribosomal protein L16 3-hydroxylase